MTDTGPTTSPRSVTEAPSRPGYALFETALGTCAIAWTGAGVAGVQLPEPDPARTRAAVLRQLPSAVEDLPPAPIRAVLDAIVALLDGADVDLGEVPLDPAGVPAFNQRVYEVTRQIPTGSTLSYGEIASRLNAPGAARAVGRALGDNPYPIVVPCHRVLAADGSMHGFSAPGGIATKRRMLQIEGALPPDPPTLF